MPVPIIKHSHLFTSVPGPCTAPALALWQEAPEYFRWLAAVRWPGPGIVWALAHVPRLNGWVVHLCAASYHQPPALARYLFGYPSSQLSICLASFLDELETENVYLSRDLASYLASYVTYFLAITQLGKGCKKSSKNIQPPKWEQPFVLYIFSGACVCTRTQG